MSEIFQFRRYKYEIINLEIMSMKLNVSEYSKLDATVSWTLCVNIIH